MQTNLNDAVSPQVSNREGPDNSKNVETDAGAKLALTALQLAQSEVLVTKSGGQEGGPKTFDFGAHPIYPGKEAVPATTDGGFYANRNPKIDGQAYPRKDNNDDGFYANPNPKIDGQVYPKDGIDGGFYAHPDPNSKDPDGGFFEKPGLDKIGGRDFPYSSEDPGCKIKLPPANTNDRGFYVQPPPDPTNDGGFYVQTLPDHTFGTASDMKLPPKDTTPVPGLEDH